MTNFALQRTRAVIFDVDGTLYDARPVRTRMATELFAHCLRNPHRIGLVRLLQTFRRHREQLAEEEAEGIIRRQYRGPAERLRLPETAIIEAVEIWILERPLRHLRRHRAAGVAQLFNRLRDRDLAIAALSDYPAKAKLEALDLRVDLVVAATDHDVDRLKPHPYGLEKVVRRLDCAVDECLLIGDRDDRDGEVARRLGMPYLLRRGPRSGGAMSFRSFAELAIDHSR